MTPPGSPTPKSSPMRRQSQRLRLPLARALGFFKSPRRQRRARHDPTTAPPIEATYLQELTLPKARPQAHPHQALHPRAPMARPNASSRPPCANGPISEPYQTSNERAQQLPAVDPRLQLASPARQPKSQHTHQPPRPLRGQPVEAPHLADLSCPIDAHAKRLIRSPRRRGRAAAAESPVRASSAVLRLTANSNLTGCCTARSAGLAPFEI